MSASTFQIERTTLVQPSVRPAIVAKELVHRANAAEVMVADWRRKSGTRFLTTALWPRGHSFFTSVDNGRYDPLLVAETFRQLCILLAHTEFAVPIGHQFLLRDLNVTVDPLQLSVSDTSTVLDIEVSCTGIKRQRDTVTSLRYEAVFRRNGKIMATAGGACTILSPAVYRRIRGVNALRSSETCRPPKAAVYQPQSVGRVAAMDVVLAPTEQESTWDLRVDTRHPVFFDHPLDHVPGMLLLESARQAAAQVLGSSSLALSSITGDFAQYIELDTPCTVEARRFPKQTPDGTDVVIVTGHQNGDLRFSAVVTSSRSRS